MESNTGNELESKLFEEKGTGRDDTGNMPDTKACSGITTHLESNGNDPNSEAAKVGEHTKSNQNDEDLGILVESSDGYRDETIPTRPASISPMAARLLRQRLGRTVQPKHADSRKKSSRVLSPADSRAMSGLNLPLRAPDELIGYRLSDAAKQNFPKPIPRMSPVSNSSSSVRGQSLNCAPTTIASPVGGQYEYSPKPCVSTRVVRVDRNVITPRAEMKAESQFKCRKRAVLIGISYRMNKYQRTYVRHPQSIQKWYDVLVRWFGFFSNEIWMLTDTPKSGRNGNARQSHATPEFIKSALHWLIEDAAEGDQLFLTYSGDTAEQINNTDRFNPGHHGLVPSDYPTGDIIWDTEIYKMIKALNPSVKLTIFLDCKLSWNMIRLPFIYSATNPRGHHSTELRQWYLPESIHVMGIAEQATLALKNLSKKERGKMEEVIMQERQVFTRGVEEFKNCAKVVCFAATPTRYTLRHKMKVIAARKLEHGDYMTAAVDVIENMMRWGRQLTYRNLMLDMAEALSPPGALQHQIPQVCATQKIKLDEMLPVFF